MVSTASPIADFIIKRNDTSRAIPSTLQTRTTPTADAVNVDLTGATVRFHMRPVAEGSVIKVDALATITDALNGGVEYQWVAADTDTDGHFVCEWEVTFADATIRTFPNHRELHIVIRRDLT